MADAASVIFPLHGRLERAAAEPLRSDWPGIAARLDGQFGWTDYTTTRDALFARGWIEPVGDVETYWHARWRLTEVGRAAGEHARTKGED